MKVLLYSHAFHPSTGGVETVSMTLALGFVERGIACKVVTQTPQTSGVKFPFEVIAAPDRATQRELIRWADVVLFNGASLALQPWLLLSRKPFAWVHVGYQASCIDGLGWVDGKPAPTTPVASIKFHATRGGWLRVAPEAIKLALRQFVARRLVHRHIAITQWMASAQPFERQQLIYNPFPIGRFERANAAVAPPEFDFLFLGRLVSEKGVEVLIRAFAQVVARSAVQPRLLVIGDGDLMAQLVKLRDGLSLSSSVHFAGKQTGDALVAWVHKARIGVLPSVWHEPMGGVAIELMAAGLPLIVSKQGGLAECAGDAALTFPNGDADALAQRMLRLLAEPETVSSLADAAMERARGFSPDRFIDQYVKMLSDLARGADQPSANTDVEDVA